MAAHPTLPGIAVLPAPTAHSTVSSGPAAVSTNDVRAQLSGDWYCRSGRQRSTRELIADLGMTWDKTLELAAADLFGPSVSRSEAQRRTRSSLTPWQTAAFQWAMQHPGETLCVARDTAPAMEYEVSRRGDHVVFSMPRPGAAGEQAWGSRDGKAKFLIRAT